MGSTSSDLKAPRGKPAPSLLDGRIWVDGCFDFFHHGALASPGRAGRPLTELRGRPRGRHRAGASARGRALRRRALGRGHTGQQGPDGDESRGEVSIDPDGVSSRHVMSAGRFKMVKRSPGISTTDLVGRMLLCTKTHHMHSLRDVLAGDEGSGSGEERRAAGEAMLERIRLYATDETAKAPGVDVWFWTASTTDGDGGGAFDRLLGGIGPRRGQRIVYVDGGYDLFSSGHIEFLRRVHAAEEALARADGWFAAAATEARKAGNGGKDYGPAFVVAGVHEDGVINEWKGVNYPIMNMLERGLCVLQCKFVDAVVFGAPFVPTGAYLASLPFGGAPAAVYHGPTAFMPLTYDPYTAPRAMGIYREIGAHPYAGVNAGQIVQRILKSRDLYEARQQAKGAKAAAESASRERELLEETQRAEEAAA
ncbi:hypothetical protein DCS_05919 [Drechmeria coniospora]|uniref:Ethanolamine-phosphate cytidylyltransferase n=1 Tax=Drechmeria coniospora TaxID=98403 RepID=A0A151GA62_DRECN|nr:hypothetical protein DCS_05919 [Drechmeria coniospora]KYK53970.1 hypothetical protein DCS_05919 [Drechmeria coniospora]